MKNLIIKDPSGYLIDSMVYTPDSLSEVSQNLFKVPSSNDMDIHQYNLMLRSLGLNYRLMLLPVEYELTKVPNKVKVYVTDGKRTLLLDGNSISQDDLKMISEWKSIPLSLLSYLLKKSSPMKFIPSLCKTYNLNYVIL